MTAQPLTDDQLAARIAAAIRDAAHDCDGNCGLDKTECDASHPIQAEVLHFGQVADVASPITALAEVAAAAVQPELDRLRAAPLQETSTAIPDEAGLHALVDHTETRQLNAIEAQHLRRLVHALAGFQRRTEQLRAERDAARAQTAAVQALHQQGDHGGWAVCTSCTQPGLAFTPWPCATAQALDAASPTTT